MQEESFGIIPLKHSGDQWSVFLILHKHGNHWGFPKGNPEPGERAIESAIRELQEETGLKVEKVLITEPLVEEYEFNRGKEKVSKKVHFFPALVSGALLLQPEEIRDGKWLPIEEAFEQLTFEEARRLLTQIQSLL